MVRFPALTVFHLMSLGFLTLATLTSCGSSDSSPGVPPDGGTGAGGRAGTADAGNAGSGARSDGGASGTAGARSGTGGVGATGTGGATGPDGAACVARASLPPTPSTSLEVSGSCSAPTACGGKLDGTKWGLDSVCASDQDLFGDLYTKVRSVCSTAVISPSPLSMTGSLTVAGGELSLSVRVDASATITLPNDCSFCQCTALEQQLNSSGVIASCSPVCDNGDCTCSVNGKLAVDKTEPITISNQGIASTGGLEFDYCAAPNGLSIAVTSGSPGFATATFHGPSREVCDGVDNDLDGAVDDDPVDCPPCKNAGVCAGATTITCGGSTGWKCDYASPDYEATETKCDGLDNDCNGVVDDEPSVDAACAAIDPETTCQSGRCGCPATCHGVCTHPDTDAKNCGSCDTSCPVACSGAACTTVKQLSVGGDPCSVLADGTLRCWGFNASGELGDGTTTNRPTPNPVFGLSKVEKVAVASQHVCALMSDGTVECWGTNGSGQLGDGTNAAHHTPAPVPGLSGVTQITAGFYHTCVVRTGGAVECWGDNQWGEVGDGSGKNRNAPVSVNLTGVKTLVAGGANTCAVMTDGTLQCWGLNSWGQMGAGAPGTNALAPTPVPNLTGVSEVAPSGNHTCVLMSDQTVRCWGVNNYGQLGNGSTDPLYEPTPVPGLSGVKHVIVGDEHSCATLGDGTAQCWGHNDHGQLGDGTTTDRHVPTSVPTLAPNAQMAGGLGIVCALLGTGNVSCWGSNGYGQLGDGTTTDRHAPTPVVW